jgi:hypothetical protein
MPEIIRQWIQDNPRSTAKQQRDECYRALRNGEISGYDERTFLSPAHFHYWWSKAQTGIHRISNDPWENLEHRLTQDAQVLRLLCFPNG